MTIEQLQIFHAIIQYKTFSEAAVALHLSQSSLSKQIAKLERELGITLFDRSHRQVQLTKIGTIIYQDSKKILLDYQQLQEHIQIHREHNHKTLHIAMLPILYQYNFAKQIAQFTRQNPDIEITITEVEERDIYHDAPLHDIDVFILRDDAEQLQNYQKLRIYEDLLCSIVSSKHPMAHLKHISFQQLQHEALLLPPTYTSIVKLVHQQCETFGFTPHIQRYGRLESILAAANQNEGVALATEHSLPMFHLPDVCVLSFHHPIHADIAMFYAQDKIQKESVQKFLTYFQDLI